MLNQKIVDRLAGLYSTSVPLIRKFAGLALLATPTLGKLLGITDICRRIPQVRRRFLSIDLPTKDTSVFMGCRH